jgi:hypothetical protein
MNFQALRDEILIGPLSTTLSQYVVDQNAPQQNAYLKDKAIADALNAESGTRLVDDYVDAIDLMSRLGALTAATILEKLENASVSNPVLKWALLAVKSDTGINIGDPETQTILDSLVVNGVLTIDESTAIKQLAERPSSRAYESIGQLATPELVSIALRGNADFVIGAL